MTENQVRLLALEEGQLKADMIMLSRMLDRAVYDLNAGADLKELGDVVLMLDTVRINLTALRFAQFISRRAM